MQRSLLCLACCFTAQVAGAGEPHVLTTPSGLTIAPFAIPVAVPVAVVQRPTLFYGYGRYAPPATQARAAESQLPVAGAGAKGEDPAAADGLRGEIAALFTRRCAECHQAPGARGDFTLFDADGRLPEQLPRRLIAEHCAEGTAPAMPPADRLPLTPEEQALVRRWAVPPRGLRY